MKDDFQQLDDELTAFETELRRLHACHTNARLPDDRDRPVIANAIALHVSDSLLKLFSSPVALAVLAIFWVTGAVFGAMGSFIYFPSRIVPNAANQSMPVTGLSLNQTPIASVAQTIADDCHVHNDHVDISVSAEEGDISHGTAFALPGSSALRSMPWPSTAVVHVRKLSELALVPKSVNESHRVWLNESSGDLLTDRIERVEIEKFVPVAPKTQSEVLKELYQSLSLAD